MATQDQSSAYDEIKELLAQQSYDDVTFADNVFQFLVTKSGPKYIQGYVSVSGTILLLGKTFSPWKSDDPAAVIAKIDTV